MAHMVRLLDTSRVVILALLDVSERVNDFSNWYGQRPFILLNGQRKQGPLRVDAAHENWAIRCAPRRRSGQLDLEREAGTFAFEFSHPAGARRRTAGSARPRPATRIQTPLWEISLKVLVYRVRPGCVPGSHLPAWDESVRPAGLPGTRRPWTPRRRPCSPRPSGSSINNSSRSLPLPPEQPCRLCSANALIDLVSGDVPGLYFASL